MQESQEKTLENEKEKGWENPNNLTKITRKGRKMHCSKCRQACHNRRNYPKNDTPKTQSSQVQTEQPQPSNVSI